MKKEIARYIGFPLQDMVKGTKIIKTLSFLKESQYWDEDRIRQYQLSKLKLLIDYARKKVPYYEDLFNKIKFSSRDIHCLEDINKIPLLTKQIVREKWGQLISRDFNKFKVKKGKTGGTTGAPVIVYKDENNRTFTWASYYRWYEWMGVNYYDPVVTFWGARTVLSQTFKNKIYSWLKDSLQNNITFNSFAMTDEKLSLYASIIKKNKPALIKGYLSALILFANFVKKNNLEFESLKSISSTSETLLPHNRQFLEEVFNVPAYDQYGCGEVSAISYECSAHKGLHVNMEHVIFEILDENNNCLLNKTGRVIATDLDNYVMPFIRFENGDMAILSDEICSCGVNQPLIKSIEGRSIDTVILKDGRKVHGVFFTDILYELNIFTDKIQRFQIYQETPGEIEFRIETKVKLEEPVKRRIEKAFKNFLSKVDIREMSNLPLDESGKFRYIINKVSDQRQMF